MDTSKKMTLADLRSQHYFDIPALAQQAGVDTLVIHRMLNRKPVQRYQAALVLAALADEFGEEYTLETIDIMPLLKEEREPS